MAQSLVNGLFQWLKFGTSTPTGGTGIVSGGSLDVDPDARQRKGIGGQVIRRGGMCKFGGKAEMYVSATNHALVGYGLRASYPSGALQTLVLEGGADQWGRGYTGAVITDLSLDYGKGEALKAGITWGALGIYASTGGTQAAETALDFEDYEFVVSWQGSYYAVESFGIRVNNNVSFVSYANPKTADERRWPQSALWGAEELTFELTTGLPLPAGVLNLWGDALPSNLGSVITGTNGVNTIALTLTNLQPGAESFGFVDSNTQASYKYNFTGDSENGSLALAWS